MEKALPAIPAKRYFTIGEVSDLCGVKPYVLRYWEQEFTQLKPMKRRGNRRYYQHHEVLLIRRIRELLYEQGFTISGARNRLTELVHARPESVPVDEREPEGLDAAEVLAEPAAEVGATIVEDAAVPLPEVITTEVSMVQMRQELISIRGLLVV
jgi:DNA-binding transcriptional MerR regulator